jgi:predicted nucleic acid-binding protein
MQTILGANGVIGRALSRHLRNYTERIRQVSRSPKAVKLRVVELIASVVEQATPLRAKHALKTPDALQAACAFYITGDVLFLTNDGGFKKVPGLRVEIPV